MKHVILGNGPAGVIAAETIRQHQPNDEIILLGAEPEPPYSRMAIPYLLVGDIKEEGTYLRKTKAYFKNLNIIPMKYNIDNSIIKDNSRKISQSPIKNNS